MSKAFALPLALVALFIMVLLVMAYPAGPVTASGPAPTRPAIAAPPGPSWSGDVGSPAVAAVTPTVVLVKPTVDARGVSTHTWVAATFGTDMDPDTITGTTFLVSQGTTGIAGSVRYIVISRVAIFEPDTPLVPGTTYTATITTGTQSSSGVPLAQDTSWAFATVDAPSPLDDGMHVYFGDLHSHSRYSDGRGTPADAFATARANGLDFYALTDHSNQLTAGQWDDMLVQADAATVDGEFVGLRGFEFTHPKGHINVVDTDTYVWEGDPAYDTLEEFYTWLVAQPTAVGQFNHPAETTTLDWDFEDWAYHAGADSKIQLRETQGYPPDQYLLSLDAGWHLSAVNNSDTHQADWGRWWFMGLVAPDLTRDHILDALRARRTFCAFDRNFGLVMQANDHWMGAIIPVTSTIHFTVTAYDPDPTNRILALVLYDNGVPAASITPLSAPVLYTWTVSLAGTPGHYYYVKAYHDVDTGTIPAYTSPVWMESLDQWGKTYLPAIMRSYAGGR